jgi:transcription elongation GreA/GreB family factor
MSKLKEQLYIQCIEYLRTKEAEIKTAISEAQEAANSDTKSSAGDKFETGRESMQQEIDLNITRLNELNKQKIALEQIIPGQKGSVVMPGSVVRTNSGNYYVAISAKQVKADGVTYYAISIASPIGEKMAGKQAGDSFELNGKRIVIESVA